MTYRLLFITTVAFLLCTSMTCQRGVGFRYRTTIDVLSNVRPAVSPSTGRTIIGFKLGDFEDPREVLRTASFGPRQYEIPAAGPEFGICNDGTPLERVHDELLVRVLGLIGDTGAEDISTDGDCHCDAHVKYVELQPIEVIFADGENLRIPTPGLPGRTLMCPNTSHAFGGRTEFGGGVIATFAMRLRIADGGSRLLADIQYDIRQPRT